LSESEDEEALGTQPLHLPMGRKGRWKKGAVEGEEFESERKIRREEEGEGGRRRRGRRRKKGVYLAMSSSGKPEKNR